MTYFFHLSTRRVTNSFIYFFIFFVKILDHEQEVCSTIGKSHAVIPAFTFYRDRTGDEDEKQKRGKKVNIVIYYTAGSARGQYEANPKC